MSDRVIQRNDTAARWQQYNPILAMGEIGIITDGAKGYKIGDGATRWNDLPFPANPTNVVQETGDGENVVMSQKANTEKLAELGTEVNDVRMETIGVYKQDIAKVEPKKNNYFTLLLSEGNYIYEGLGNVSGAVFVIYADGTKDSLNKGSGIDPNIPIEFTATKQIKQLQIYVSSDTDEYGFEIKTKDSISADIEGLQKEVANTDKKVTEHDVVINTKLLKGGDCEIIETIADAAMDKGTIFTSGGWVTAVAKVKAGTTVYPYIDGKQGSCRYGLYESKPTKGSTTSMASNSASSITIPSDKDYYIAITENGASKYGLKFVNESSVIGDLEKLNKVVLTKEGFLDVATEQGKYLDHNNAYIGTASGWTIGTATAEAGSTLQFYADGALASCRYALYDGTTSMSNWSGIGGGGSTSINVPSDKDYIVVVCLHKNVSQFTISYKTDGLDNRVAELEETAMKNTSKHSVLWLGTSIPCYSHYPEKVCELLGHDCYNMAIGSSGIIVRSGVEQGDRNGKDLCESAAEKETRYRQAVNSGLISEEQLNTYKTYGYDARVLPYIDGTIASCDVVVIDHGYNDRDTDIMQGYIDGFDSLDLSIDASSYDRSNFIGAFRFLVDKILSVNPNIKIVICSYLENKTGSPEFPKPVWDSSVIYNSGYQICTLLKKLAEHYNFPFMNMCDYNGFTVEYLPNSNTYLPTNYPSYSLKRYTNRPNPSNNITKFQYYCPDGVHPHTDVSGRSTEIIVSSLVKLMRDL